jgi:hypothetical protein
MEYTAHHMCDTSTGDVFPVEPLPPRAARGVCVHLVKRSPCHASVSTLTAVSVMSTSWHGTAPRAGRGARSLGGCPRLFISGASSPLRVPLPRALPRHQRPRAQCHIMSRTSGESRQQPPVRSGSPRARQRRALNGTASAARRARDGGAAAGWIEPHCARAARRRGRRARLEVCVSPERRDGRPAGRRRRPARRA